MINFHKVIDIENEMETIIYITQVQLVKEDLIKRAGGCLFCFILFFSHKILLRNISEDLLHMDILCVHIDVLVKK